MDRSLMAKALAKGTRRIDLKILDDAEVVADAIDAECIDANEPPPAVVEPIAVARVRSVTNAYAPLATDRPVIAIG